MRLSIAQLKRNYACEEGLQVVEKLFGKSAEVTLENCVKAAKHPQFCYANFGWAATTFLSSRQVEKYYELVDRYDNMRDILSRKLNVHTYDRYSKPWKIYKVALAYAFYIASIS